MRYKTLKPQSSLQITLYNYNHLVPSYILVLSLPSSSQLVSHLNARPFSLLYISIAFLLILLLLSHLSQCHLLWLSFLFFIFAIVISISIILVTLFIFVCSVALASFCLIKSPWSKYVILVPCIFPALSLWN